MKYYLLSEAAKILGVKQITLRTYIFKGYLKGDKMGGRNWKISATELKGLKKRSKVFWGRRKDGRPTKKMEA
jgi:excisionase family DNA binding protein